MLMMKRRSGLPPLTMMRMNCMKPKALPSTLAGGRCDVCVPIRYEKEWTCIKRFTQLQRDVKLFSRNSGDMNDALNMTVNTFIRSSTMSLIIITFILC
jgi:hypothetical protein